MTMYDRVQTLLVDKFGVPADDIRPEATFEELDLDSLDLVEFALAAEEELGVRITDEEAEQLATLADALSCSSRREQGRVSQRTVAVTGLGLVTPAGIGVESSWAAVLAGRSTAATDPVLDGLPVDMSCRVPGFDAAALLDRKAARRLDRFTQLALVAAREAVADAGLDPSSWDGARVGVVLGCGMGGAETWESQHRRFLDGGAGRVSPLLIPMLVPNMVAGQLAMEFGATGPNLVTATACASGATAIGVARDLLRSRACDVVLTGGTEAGLTPLSMAAFAQMGALSTRTGEPAAASRPFDVDRDGFVAAEAAGVVVLERDADARARGRDHPRPPGGLRRLRRRPPRHRPGPGGTRRRARGPGCAQRCRPVPCRRRARQRPRHVDPAQRRHRGAHVAPGPRRRVRRDVDEGGHRSRARCGRRDRGGVQRSDRAARADPPDREPRQPGSRDRHRRRREGATRATGRCRPVRLVRLRRTERGAGAHRRMIQNVHAFADPGSFNEVGSAARHRVHTFGMQAKRPAGDGVVTGTATVEGRPVALYAQDPAVLGGSLGETHATKITRVLDHAARARVPVVGLLDSGGARIQEGVGALDGYGEIFRRNVSLSGRVPQVSVVLGSCAGGAVYSPALTDIVIMAEDRAHMFVTGPRVVKAVTFEDVSAIDLGGAELHATTSGVAHLVADDSLAALAAARRVLAYLPSSCWDPAPVTSGIDAEPMREVPADPRRPYDARDVVAGIVDAGSFIELQAGFARNVVVGFARLEGASVGVVANQPLVLAGCLDITASEKAARFVRLCDAFGLPLVTLVDVPGFLPGSGQESGGIIRKGAKLLYAFAEATVPRVTVITRKAFGGAYIVMNSRSLGADAVFSWPGAEIAVMGAEGAVDVIFRRELAADPSRRDELIAGYRAEAMAPHLAAERLSVDEVIKPAETRDVVAATLRSLARANEPRFRHDNLPQ
jgi:propionyl-CoA carboxylase beta chain